MRRLFARLLSTIRKLEIYTDGSYIGNKKMGGMGLNVYENVKSLGIDVQIVTNKKKVTTYATEQSHCPTIYVFCLQNVFSVCPSIFTWQSESPYASVFQNALCTLIF